MLFAATGVNSPGFMHQIHLIYINLIKDSAGEIFSNLILIKKAGNKEI